MSVPGEFVVRRFRVIISVFLRIPRRRRLAGAERGSRDLQTLLNRGGERVCASHHAPRGPFRVLECRHGLAEIVERSAVVGPGPGRLSSVEATSLESCSIKAVIDSFDINVCAVGMLPRGLGKHDYIVAPEVEQAIRSKTMRLRPQHGTTPGRVEKYQSRGFTLLE